MTISTSQNQQSYVGDGVSTAFTYAFPFITITDLKVYLNGVLQSSGYTVTGNAPAGGSGTFAKGTVTFGVAPASLATILIYCDPDQLQSTSLPPNDPFPSKTVEKALDKLTLLIQRLYAKFGNAITMPVGETLNGVLPPAAQRANQLASFDALGNIVTVAAAAQSATALTIALATPAGPSLIGFDQTQAYANTTLGAKERDWVSPTDSPWLADKTGVADAVPAINACYQFCKTQTPPRKMRILDGTYLLGTAPTTFELPRDDGSFSPTIGAGETTLAAEAAVTMPVCLTFNGNVEVEGESAEGVILLGNWTYTSSSIDTSQRIAILQGTSKDSFTQFKFKNLYVKNNMIAVVVQGAATNSDIDIVIDGAGIAIAAQAFEGNSRSSGRRIRCYAGDIVGGWWLQRNRTCSATNMPSSFGGSYPASDIFRGCWGENIVQERIEWTAQPVFDARADSVDTFFNTNFFKTANSAVYPTGRATVNADASFGGAAGYPTYRGVFGWTWWITSRNGRFGSRMKQSVLVSSGSSRGSMYVNAGAEISQRQLYFENSALVDPAGGTGGGNIMGTGRADPYRAGAPNSLSLQLDTEGSLGTYQEEIGGFNNGPGVPAVDPARRYNVQLGNRSSKMFELLGGIRFLDTDSPMLRYQRSQAWTPTLFVGATQQAGLNIDRATFNRLDDSWEFELQLSKASLVISGTGAITIQGLPVSGANGGNASVSYFSMVTSASQLAGCFINGTTIELHKALNRSSPLTQADLTNGALVITVSGKLFA